MVKTRIWTAALVLGLLLSLPAGCQVEDVEKESRIFAMDTVMTLTYYGQDRESGREALEEGVAAVYELEDLLSATAPDSEISALNEAGQAHLSPDTAQLLSAALELCALTGGALDITAYPAVEAWGFTTGEYRVPNQAELEELGDRIDYTQVSLDQEGASLPDGMKLDLGAVAKGYTADRLAKLAQERGITSALLDLGQSTILALGAKPDGSPWRIGIQDPQGEGYLGVLELEGQAMGTSGGYQRYFERDGVRYWHIIDPATAAPARSGLLSVTVVSPSGLACDGLSTALFVMGLERGTQFWRDHPELEFEALFILEDGSLALTSGLKDSFTLAQGYEDREVEVLS
ncbi:FAD:protein FMN transferase [Muriventricola aceti]|uniref:FAD:protein FMN transferase n=1 Tax=Muriventricola aceti TaxID=2981773 RepID=UPI000823388A|nr:FAD:protein FMN transferase [Muriventricola aceti]MCU6702307.1 FAD:protein FMN transferase [Muriventricola aceti]SCI99683.1 Thiamine biosynthesis lipoprotein ApbE precursor [uncultured Flavonifractor sp.]